MEYTTLGDTGLSVSRISLGTMNVGHEAEGWTPEATVGAVELSLPESDVEYLEAPDEPVAVTGHD